MGLDVPQKSRKLETKPATRLDPLVKVAKGRAEMAPRRSWHPSDEPPAEREESQPPEDEGEEDQGEEEEQEDDKPKHGILMVKPGSRCRL